MPKQKIEPQASAKVLAEISILGQVEFSERFVPGDSILLQPTIRSRKPQVRFRVHHPPSCSFARGISPAFLGVQTSSLRVSTIAMPMIALVLCLSVIQSRPQREEHFLQRPAACSVCFAPLPSFQVQSSLSRKAPQRHCLMADVLHLAPDRTKRNVHWLGWKQFLESLP